MPMAAAMPAPCPMDMQVPMTRVEPWAVCVALWQRPARYRLFTLRE